LFEWFCGRVPLPVAPLVVVADAADAGGGGAFAAIAADAEALLLEGPFVAPAAATLAAAPAPAVRVGATEMLLALVGVVELLPLDEDALG
jgi:hypothetical protein